MEDYHSDEDIFADETTGSGVPMVSPKTPTCQDSSEVSRLKMMMGGIPPPPEVTHPNVDVPTIVSSWYTNHHLWWEISQKTINSVKKDFDVYLNCNCEEAELLRLKIAERLVSSETSSSFVKHEILTNSAKKRQRRNGWAKSPGSRLSYLAKRRNAFCKRTNDLTKARTISIIKDDSKKCKQGGQHHLKRALFQSPENSDFTTPDPHCKRQRLMSLSERSQSSAVKNKNYGNSNSKFLTCTRNLDSEFDKFKCEKLLNMRQIIENCYSCKTVLFFPLVNHLYSSIPCTHHHIGCPLLVPANGEVVKMYFKNWNCNNFWEITSSPYQIFAIDNVAYSKNFSVCYLTYVVYYEYGYTMRQVNYSSDIVDTNDGDVSNNVKNKYKDMLTEK